jgi:hypothetical protein
VIYVAPALQLTPYNIGPNTPRVGYRNIITADNISATEEADERPVINLANPATDPKSSWQGTTTGLQYVQVAQAATGVDYFGLARHNLGSTGAVVRLQGSNDNVAWTDLTSDVAPGNDYALMQVFTPASYSYWRLRIVPGSAAPQIAVWYLGKVLSMQRTLYVGHTPITMGRTWSVTSGVSEDGQFLGRTVRHEELVSSVDFKHLTPEWYRAELDLLFDDGVALPFFWAWRPGDFPEEVGYAWFTSPPQVSNQLPNGMMQASWSMKGIR